MERKLLETCVILDLRILEKWSEFLFKVLLENYLLGLVLH